MCVQFTSSGNGKLYLDSEEAERFQKIIKEKEKNITTILDSKHH